MIGCGSWGLSSSDCSSEGYLQGQTQAQSDPPAPHPVRDRPGPRNALLTPEISNQPPLTSLPPSNSSPPIFQVQGETQEPCAYEPATWMCPLAPACSPGMTYSEPSRRPLL